MLLETSYRSTALKSMTQVNIIIPDSHVAGTPLKTLWLLHGLSGDHSLWLRNTCIERYAAAYNVAVVMPNVDRSWYTNTAYDVRYFDFVSDELPKLYKKLFADASDAREDNIVGGLSMGGYGAMKLALNLPDRYSACISLSGSLDITRKNRPYDLGEWRSIFGLDLESALDLEGTSHDLFALLRKKAAEGVSFPDIYMWCGTEDSLITVNDSFDALLTELGIPHVYETSEGDHSWRWWDMHIVDGLDFVFKK